MYKRNFSPSNEQIAAACRRIRRRWSEDERLFRAGLSERRWELPQVVLDRDLAEKVQEWEMEAVRYPRRG